MGNSKQSQLLEPKRKLNVGDKICLPGQKKPYKVMARNERYIICTQPYNFKHTVMYFIIDLERGIRGPDNMIFCFGYETALHCAERLDELERGVIEVSQRRCVELDLWVE